MPDRGDLPGQDATLAIRDMTDFRDIGIGLLDPWFSADNLRITGLRKVVAAGQDLAVVV
jgi:hypothetical protein